MKNILTVFVSATLMIVFTGLTLAGPEPRPRLTPTTPAVITSCINSNCRCVTSFGACIDCIFDNCDAKWTDDEDRLYNWWCRNKNTKGC